MTFDEIWREVRGLPDTAIIEVPDVLSESTKRKLCKYSIDEISRIVTQAIDEVDYGSVEPLDTLIRRRLQ